MGNRENGQIRDIFRKVELGNVGAVKSYLKHGGKVNVENEGGVSLIRHAANHKQWGIVKILQDKGAREKVTIPKAKNVPEETQQGKGTRRERFQDRKKKKRRKDR
ncbi:hypothetical protein KAR91_75530 [Candidatus Pacearchaeota archaeon]|nr:hypothetical protein [Candidatus Pacearchaeota archaeon]